MYIWVIFRSGTPTKLILTCKVRLGLRRLQLVEVSPYSEEEEEEEEENSHRPLNH